jgi:hypothetical protein
VGLGYPFLSGEKTKSLILMFGGMLRVKEKFALITENWFTIFSNPIAIFSYGVRFFGPKLRFDIGFINSKRNCKAFNRRSALCGFSS